MRFYLSVVLLLVIWTCQSQSATIINYDIQIKANPAKVTRTYSYLIKVADKDGSWLGDISIFYSDKNKYKLHEALLLDKNHSVVRKIKKKDIESMSAQSRGTFFDDRMLDVFTFMHNEFPYYIKYSYTIAHEDFLHLGNLIPRMYQSIPVQKASMSLTRPVDYRIAIDSSGQFKYSESTSDNLITQTWSIHNPLAITNEPYAPPKVEQQDRLTIVPLDFTYGVSGNQSSWAYFGHWLTNLNRDLDVLPDSEILRLKTQFGHITDTVELIKSLYNFLQDNTRYINVTLDIGGLKSYPAKYVLKNQYGDCKALTMYMKSMLKAFDIPAYYAIVKAGANQQRVNVDFPSQQFNHVILCVPVDQDTIWLENTASYLPFGYMGSFTQNRKSLVVNGINSRLVDIPPLPLEHSSIANEFDLALVENTLQGKLISSRHGHEFEDLAYANKLYTPHEKTEYVMHELKKWNCKFDNAQITITDRNKPLGTLQVNLIFPNSVKQIGDRLILLDLPQMKDLPSSGHFKERTRPIRFSEPINIKDTFTIDITNIDSAFTPLLPDSVDIKCPYGRYMASYTVEPNQVRVLRTLTINQTSAPSDEAIFFYNLLTAIEDEQKQPIVFKKL